MNRLFEKILLMGMGRVALAVVYAAGYVLYVLLAWVMAGPDFVHLPKDMRPQYMTWTGFADALLMGILLTILYTLVFFMLLIYLGEPPQIEFVLIKRGKHEEFLRSFFHVSSAEHYLATMARADEEMVYLGSERLLSISTERQRLIIKLPQSWRGMKKARVAIDLSFGAYCPGMSDEEYNRRYGEIVEKWIKAQAELRPEKHLSRILRKAGLRLICVLQNPL